MRVAWRHGGEVHRGRGDGGFRSRPGGASELISARLGHSTITITLDRDGHLFPSVEEALAEKLDAAFNASANGEASSNVVALES